MIKTLIVTMLAVTTLNAEASKPGFVFDGSQNLIVLKGPIGSADSDRALEELMLAPANPIFYLDSGGGVVQSGLEMFQAIQARGDVTCMSPYAASMAFAIMQACKVRIGTGPLPYFLQHRIQVVLNGQQDTGDLEYKLNILVKPMQKLMNELQAVRLGLTPEELATKTRAPWIIVGKENLLKNNIVDSVTDVSCKGGAFTKKRKSIVMVNENVFSPPKAEVITFKLCPIIDIKSE